MKPKAHPPLLANLRATPSPNGRFAHFVLVNRAGQHMSFLVPFEKLGFLLDAIKKTIHAMRERLFSREADAEAAVERSLAQPVSVNAVSLGRDAETQDALVCFETEDSGTFSFRLRDGLTHQLNDGLAAMADEAASIGPDAVRSEAAEANDS